MNKEQLQKRLEEIQKHIDQALANLNMLMGGKEECLHWLKQLDTNIGLDDLKKIIGADSIELIDNKDS